MTRHEVKYGAYAGALPPQAIKIKPGGWGGAAEGTIDGSQPQPWHCLPFVEASTYGLELLYPYETECRVVHDEQGVQIEFDYASEPAGNLSGGEFIFFNSSGPPQFYLFNCRLDIQSPVGHVLRTEPHPRFFTDTSGTVPLALIGHVQSEWYPRKLFVVFKVPPRGSAHVFRRGEAYAQIVFVPQKVTYDLSEFTAEQESDRRNLERDLESVRALIASNQWQNPTGARFNDHYKVLARQFSQGGMDEVRRTVDAALGRQRAQMPPTVAECLALGDELVRRQEFDEAKPVYVYVLDQQPNHPIALRQLGICIACSGAPGAGLKLMIQAAELEPGEPLHHVSLGQMYQLLGRFQESEQAYLAALRLQSDVPEWMSALHGVRAESWAQPNLQQGTS